jgi:hypothetical protein
MSTDHSTLFQNFHSEEWQNASVLIMLQSEDGETTQKPCNGTSTVFLKPSRTTTGNHTHLTSNQTVAQATSDVQLLTQDGGNCSDMKVVSLPMRKER